MAEVERPVRLPKVEFPTEAAIKATIDKGSSFLKKRQNVNGSWGSARQTKGLNIFAPVPGSHRAFQLAVTALSTAALIENKGGDPAYAESVQRDRQRLINELEGRPEGFVLDGGLVAIGRPTPPYLPEYERVD